MCVSTVPLNITNPHTATAATLDIRLFSLFRVAYSLQNTTDFYLIFETIKKREISVKKKKKRMHPCIECRMLRKKVVFKKHWRQGYTLEYLPATYVRFREVVFNAFM